MHTKGPYHYFFLLLHLYHLPLKVPQVPVSGCINEILKKSQKQFAYRVRDDILFYLVENKKADLLDEDTAFDYQIMQKILPAINGSEQSVYQVLIDLLNFIFETNDIETVEEAENHLETTTVKYENSAKKIIYMLKGYQNDGYVSYWY